MIIYLMNRQEMHQCYDMKCPIDRTGINNGTVAKIKGK